MNYRANEPPLPTPHELLSTLPGESSFDLVDLWRLTGSLCAELPGVAVIDISSEVENAYNAPGAIVANLAWNHPSHLHNIQFENIELAGEREDLEALRLRTVEAMGYPAQRPLGGVIERIEDTRPNNSPRPDDQKTVARIFLSRVSRIILNSSEGSGEAQQFPINELGGVANIRLHMIKQAVLNLRLAQYTAQAPGPYQDLVRRAYTWELRDESSPFPWL